MRIDLGDTVPFLPEEVHLFHNRKKMLRWHVERFGTKPMLDDMAHAQAVMRNGIAAVLIEVVDVPQWEYALLVHEAYHIVCWHLSELGEECAGEEITAYMLQLLSGALMGAHKKWRKKHVRDEEGQLCRSDGGDL